MILISKPMDHTEWIERQTEPKMTSRFTSTWSNTLTELEREYNAIKAPGAGDPILMVTAEPEDFRKDGQLRAQARLRSNAVALSIQSRYGPLIFRSDRFNGIPWHAKMPHLWQHNVRAIMLTLEALRLVDRYGIVLSGEQYQGFRQLAAPSHVSQDRMAQARFHLCKMAGVVLEDTDTKDQWRAVVRKARRFSHPDYPGGSQEAFHAVQECARLLGLN